MRVGERAKSAVGFRCFNWTQRFEWLRWLAWAASLALRLVGRGEAAATQPQLTQLTPTNKHGLSASLQSEHTVHHQRVRSILLDSYEANDNGCSCSSRAVSACSTGCCDFESSFGSPSPLSCSLARDLSLQASTQTLLLTLAGNLTDRANRTEREG